MEPKVLSSDTCQAKAQSRRLPWLPPILLVLVALVALLAVGGSASAQSGPEGAESVLWTTNFCYSGMQCAVGDFNGDGKADIIQFNHAVNPAGSVYVALSNGSGFNPPVLWHSSFCVGNSEICKVADFNGDKKDDIITFVRSSGTVWVALSNGNGFASSSIWRNNFCMPNEICDVGDYNGDGKADISTFTRSLYADTGLVWVALSNGTTGFGTASVWVKFFCIEQEMCGSGDFNGDGKDDVVVFSKNYGPVYVATSTGSKFNKTSGNTPWRDFFCPGQEVCGVADFNGDDKDDIVTYLRSSYANDPDPAARKIGYVYVALSNGSSFPNSTLRATDFCIGQQTCGSGNYIDTVGVTSYTQVSRTGDYDANRRADLISFLRSTNLTYEPGYVYVDLTPSPPNRWVMSLYIKPVLP
jgi:hypothetical protein